MSTLQWSTTNDTCRSDREGWRLFLRPAWMPRSQSAVCPLRFFDSIGNSIRGLAGVKSERDSWSNVTDHYTWHFVGPHLSHSLYQDGWLLKSRSADRHCTSARDNIARLGLFPVWFATVLQFVFSLYVSSFILLITNFIFFTLFNHFSGVISIN